MTELKIPDDLRELYERVNRSTREMGWKWTLTLFERIARLEQERDALRAQLREYTRSCIDCTLSLAKSGGKLRCPRCTHTLETINHE